MRDLVYENYYTAESPEELFLMHHGIKGQKWYYRRFQNDDGSLTAAGRARYLTGKAKEYVSKKYEEHKATSEQRKVAKAERQEELRKIKEEKRAANEQKREEEAQADMNDAIARGDQARISKYVSRMTTQQLQDAVNRVRLNQQLDQLAPKKVSLIEKVGNKAQTIANLNNSINNAVTSYRKVKDLFKPSDDDDDDDTNYQSTTKEARKAAANQARKDSKANGGSLYDQEVAAREAIKEFDKATRDSKNGSSTAKDAGGSSSLFDKQKTFSARIKDLSSKDFSNKPTGSYIHNYWKKQRTPLRARVDTLNDRLKYLD